MQINAAARLSAGYVIDLSKSDTEILRALMLAMHIQARPIPSPFKGELFPAVTVNRTPEELKTTLLKFFTKTYDDSTERTIAVSGQGLEDFPEAHGKIWDFKTFILSPTEGGALIVMVPRHQFLKYKHAL